MCRTLMWVERRWAFYGVLALCSLSAACDNLGDPPECIVSLECPANQLCMDGRCIDGTLGLDGGDAAVAGDGSIAEPGDGGAMDGGREPEGDAGPPMPDAGPSCNEPSCNQCADRHPDAIVCETFDDDLSAWFPFIVGGGSAETSTSRYHLGGQSLRATTPAGGGEGTIRRALAPAIDTGEFFIKVEVFLVGGPPLESSVPLFFVRSRSGSGKVSIDIGANDVPQLIQTGSRYVGGPPRSFPRDRWVCVEAHARFEDGTTPGLLELWVDGTRIDAASGSAVAAPAEAYDDIKVGAVSFMSAANDVEVYIDEVVVSRDARIGCTD